MRTRTIHDEMTYAHIVTFSCFKRRRLLDPDQAKAMVVSFLASQLERQRGRCIGFVVMPDHVHAAVWFEETGNLSRFVQQWKRRTSIEIRRHFENHLPNYAAVLGVRDPVWQPKYHSFEVYSEKKLREKLDYMHMNPVRAGLVENPEDWRFSSAGFYLCGRSVGVPIGFD